MGMSGPWAQKGQARALWTGLLEHRARKPGRLILVRMIQIKGRSPSPIGEGGKLKFLSGITLGIGSQTILS